jgi:predicted RNase H-like HicB family nuclease
MPHDPSMPVEIEREEDGRWIAEIPSVPGVLAYGRTPDEAQARAKALALRIVADRRWHGEPAPGSPVDDDHAGSPSSS